ncbi:MAG: ParB/RepB/Spo0J family partition protein [Patescibacteria group bacterium]
MSYFHQDSVFWVEVDKIEPNPYQPRREFNEEELQSLANSIRQYGVLQALVVTRQELPKEDGGLSVKYELISGERRLRAAKLAGVKQVPVLIRSGEENDLMKLELAIIENLQREDLNVVERARAFDKLAKKFSFNKTQIAKKVGKSREYVSNTMRILTLPDEILNALSSGRLSEGHARPLLMLSHRPEEQKTLFKEVMYKKSSVRETERIAKKIAKEKVRKPSKVDPELETLEKEFTESLGTRVNIESKEVGGKISIDYFSQEDLHALLDILKLYKKQGNAPMLENFLAQATKDEGAKKEESASVSDSDAVERDAKQGTYSAGEVKGADMADVYEEKDTHPKDPKMNEGQISEQDTTEAVSEEVPQEGPAPEKTGIWERISASFYSRAEDDDAKIYRGEKVEREDINDQNISQDKDVYQKEKSLEEDIEELTEERIKETPYEKPQEERPPQTESVYKEDQREFSSVRPYEEGGLYQKEKSLEEDIEELTEERIKETPYEEPQEERPLQTESVYREDQQESSSGLYGEDTGSGSLVEEIKQESEDKSQNNNETQEESVSEREESGSSYEENGEGTTLSEPPSGQGHDDEDLYSVRNFSI